MRNSVERERIPEWPTARHPKQKLYHAARCGSANPGARQVDKGEDKYDEDKGDLVVQRLNRLAIAVVGEIRRAMPTLAAWDRDLVSQMRRAVASVPLNLAEGLRRTGRDREHLLGVALGSAAEVRAILNGAAAAGTLSAATHEALEAMLDRVGAMTYRLRARRG